MTDAIPYGSWPSIITAHDVVAGGSTPTSLHAADGVVWWGETRPQESGREAIVRRDADGSLHEVLPADFNPRTAVHEYGGGAWWVHGGTVYATAWADQRLYRIDPGSAPVAITPAPPSPRSWRYADGRVTPDGRWIVCVRERHEGPDPAVDVHNELVVLPVDGSSEPRVVFSGTDFVAAPRISRDGRQLAWLAWDHPNMPWDSTQLWVGLLEDVAGMLHLRDERREAGAEGESLVQPEWGRHATLYVCSDRSDWWNVHRVEGVDRLVPVRPVDSEVSVPAWVFGQSRYVVLPDGTIVTTHPDGRDTVITSIPEDGSPRSQRLEDLMVRSIAHDGERVIGIVSFPDRPVEVRSLPDGEVLRPGAGITLPSDWVSLPERVVFPTADGATAHAWLHLPTNPGVQPPPDAAPPPLVGVHGGADEPGGSRLLARCPVLDLARVRRRRCRLPREQWLRAPLPAAAQREVGCGRCRGLRGSSPATRGDGVVDPRHMAIRGGSAGGLTALPGHDAR